MGKKKMRPHSDHKSKSAANKRAQYVRHNQQKQVRVRKISGGYRVYTGDKRKRRHLKGRPSNYEP